MKNLIVGNWKSHKTQSETQAYFDYLLTHRDVLNTTNTDIVICPSFSSLAAAQWRIHDSNLPLMLGAQNVSPFPIGAYTGEVSATQIAEFAKYVIIGHSERRTNFQENDTQIQQKIQQAKNAGLQVIVCVQDRNGLVYEEVDVVAYEPISAIGTGHPDDPSNVKEVLDVLREKYPSAQLLYGGSVNKESIQQYLSLETVQGFLVGGASLDPEEFISLISACETKK